MEVGLKKALKKTAKFGENTLTGTFEFGNIWRKVSRKRHMGVENYNECKNVLQ